MTPGTETDQAEDVITTTIIGMRFRFIYLVSFIFFSGNGILFVGLCSRIMKLIIKKELKSILGLLTLFSVKTVLFTGLFSVILNAKIPFLNKPIDVLHPSR